MNYMVKRIGSAAYDYDALKESINLLDRSKQLVTNTIAVNEASHPLYMVYEHYDQLREKLQKALDNVDALLDEMEQ